MRDRSCFGYMEPDPAIPDFAQCGSCQLFIKDRERCYWLSDKDDVDADDSCIMYVQGEPMPGVCMPTGSLTAKEVGFTKAKVRCENCNAFNKDKSGCRLFAELNELLPRVFKLDNKVKPKACCNAWDDKVEPFAASRLLKMVKAA